MEIVTVSAVGDGPAVSIFRDEYRGDRSRVLIRPDDQVSMDPVPLQFFSDVEV